MSPKDHDCPADGCTKTVPHTRIFCPKHWFRVPKAIRDAVWGTAHLGIRHSDHLQNVKTAIQAVNDKLAAEAK